MGGTGSGRWFRQNTKMTTASLPRLQISTLKNNGCLEPGFTGTFSWSGRGLSSSLISFKSEEDRIHLNDPLSSETGHNGQKALIIQLDRLPCHYGGDRTWFLCPQCGGRTKSLYKLGIIFACRVCHGLTYASQQENKIDRLIERIHRIFERLGSPETDTFSPIPKKKPGMHMKTYEKLRIAVEEAQDQLKDNVIQRFGYNGL